MRRLCNMRYWTRKWIIQELLKARTVVLQAGKSKCSMQDLEKFCQELYQNRRNADYIRSPSLRSELWQPLVASAAARLALQRSEIVDGRQPRLLHELVERYASSECGLPCDHVYALYSLVGDHREYFHIDYAASPGRRLADVLSFVHNHERMSPSRMLAFVDLLKGMLGVSKDDVRHHHTYMEDVDLVVSATSLGTVELKPESDHSLLLRRRVLPLDGIQIFRLGTTREVWRLTEARTTNNRLPRVGGSDMSYFGISGTGLTGLAACRLQDGDTIGHFPGTQLAFAVRSVTDGEAQIIGRAYLFAPSKRDGDIEFWLNLSPNPRNVVEERRQISTSLATLLEIMELAIASSDNEVNAGFRHTVPWTMEDFEAVWTTHGQGIARLTGLCKSNRFVIKSVPCGRR